MTNPVRLPRTHVALRAGIALATLILVVAVCRWGAGGGRAAALAAWEVKTVRHAWHETISTLQPVWKSLEQVTRR